MTLTLTNPYKKRNNVQKPIDTNTSQPFDLDQNPIKSEVKARAGEYRPKQTDYDIADGINRSFAKKRFIEIHQIYKWHGFIRRPSRKYDRLW